MREREKFCGSCSYEISKGGDKIFETEYDFKHQEFGFSKNMKMNYKGYDFREYGMWNDKGFALNKHGNYGNDGVKGYHGNEFWGNKGCEFSMINGYNFDDFYKYGFNNTLLNNLSITFELLNKLEIVEKDNLQMILLEFDLIDDIDEIILHEFNYYGGQMLMDFKYIESGRLKITGVIDEDNLINNFKLMFNGNYVNNENKIIDVSFKSFIKFKE